MDLTKSKKEHGEIGGAFITGIAEKIIADMADITPEESAVLNTKGGYIERVIPQKGIRLSLKEEVVSKVKKIIEAKTFLAEINTENDEPIIRFFFRETEIMEADH